MTPTTEIWRPVLGYEGLYEVSDLGGVRSVDREVLCADGKKQSYRGRVLSPKKNYEGRRFVNLSKSGKTHLRPVAVLVLEAHAGPRPSGHFGCHNDGNPANNTVGNLRWDTPGANNRDKVRHGRDHQASKTHCPRGHLLVPPNLVPSKARQGHRNCRACGRVKNANLLPADLLVLADDHYARIMRAA